MTVGTSVDVRIATSTMYAAPSTDPAGNDQAPVAWLIVKLALLKTKSFRPRLFQIVRALYPVTPVMSLTCPLTVLPAVTFSPTGCEVPPTATAVPPPSARVKRAEAMVDVLLDGTGLGGVSRHRAGPAREDQ